MVLGRSIAPSAVFTQPYGRVIFIRSSVNAYSEWIWCMETLIIYHMYLFWHGRVWRHHLCHMGRYMISLNISLQFITSAIIWYQNIQIKSSIGNYNRDPMLWKFVLYFNWCVLQEDSTNKIISVDISASQFNEKNTMIFDVSNGINVRFVHRVI